MSEIRTNLLKSERGDASPSAPFGLRITGVCTATTFKGNLTGAVTGAASQLATDATGVNLTLSGNLGVGGTLTYEDVTRIDAVGLSTFREGFGVGPLTGIALTAYKDGSIRTSGIVTAASYYGSGANLTSIPSGQLTGALPAIDGSALTGINTAFGSGTSVNTTGIITATAFIPSQGQLSHRNLIVNGAMNVAQRATSNTNSNQGYQTVDRFQLSWGGADSVIEQHQGTLTSSDTGPWQEGFRKEYHIVNGNQNSGAGAADYCQIVYRPEGQDINRSGWNFTDPNSKVTLSFWIKSEVAQNFYGFIETGGPTRVFPYETGTLSANTWKKVIVTIPGYASVAIPDTNATALSITFLPFYGTNYTHATARSVGSWYDATPYCPNNTSTWWTTDNATFQITGVQLEVGPVATPFEHRSYADDLLRCQRYFEVYYMNAGTGGLTGLQSNGNNHENSYQFKVQKRAQPTGALMGNASWYSATPNLFTSPTECGFHNGSSWFQLSDGSQDASLGFNAEL